MGWSSESEFPCKKHQNQKQPEEGVCPFCLRERLSQLSSNSRRIAVVAPSCSSSTSSLSPGFYSPTTSSKIMSPKRRGHSRNVSDVMGSFSKTLSVESRLKKSRSMAFEPRNFIGGEGKSAGRTKKTKGFWSKLLRFEGKKGTNFMSSKMVKERL